ncbi:MAG: hypothetical protein ACP5N3_04125 [Candidatus Nanoarchaeia archaeon]
MEEPIIQPKKKKIYYFEKWIFRGVVFALFLLFVYSLFAVGFTSKVYAYCPNYSGMCHNPFYNNCDMLTGRDESVLFAKQLCNQTYLFPGTTIGEKPTWFMRNNGWIVFFIVFSGFFLNHFLYNKPSQLRLRRME